MQTSVPIMELPIDRIPAAADFLKQHGRTRLDQTKVRHTASLLAGDVERIVGVALAYEIHAGRVDLFVTFDPQAATLDLARQLADRALCKMLGHGIHSCHIVPAGPADVREFWQQINWLDHAMSEPAR